MMFVLVAMIAIPAMAYMEKPLSLLRNHEFTTNGWEIKVIQVTDNENVFAKTRGIKKKDDQKFVYVEYKLKNKTGDKANFNFDHTYLWIGSNKVEPINTWMRTKNNIKKMKDKDKLVKKNAKAEAILLYVVPADQSPTALEIEGFDKIGLPK